jgi:hypothetical protein
VFFFFPRSFSYTKTFFFLSSPINHAAAAAKSTVVPVKRGKSRAIPLLESQRNAAIAAATSATL